MLKSLGAFPWVIVVVLILSACAAVGPDYAQPEPPVPDAWEMTQDSGLQATNYELIER